MSDLEKQAIEYFKNYSIWNQSQGFPRGKNDSAIETVLNLIEKKDKIIDEMAEHIVSSAIVDDTVCAIKCDCDNGVECSHKKMLKCTKDYFKKKVEDK